MPSRRHLLSCVLGQAAVIGGLLAVDRASARSATPELVGIDGWLNTDGPLTAWQGGGAIRSLLGLAHAGAGDHPADDVDLSRIGTPEIYFGSLHSSPQDRAQSPRQGEAAYTFAGAAAPN